MIINKNENFAFFKPRALGGRFACQPQAGRGLNSRQMQKKHIFIFFSLMIWIVNVSAQKMSVGFIFPAGGERGTTTDIEIGGLNLAAATEVIISGDGIKAEIIPLNVKKNQGKARKNIKGKLDDQSSPQLADRIGVRVTIEKNATPGLRDLRLQSPGGVSNKLNFEVGQYPNILEQKGSTNSKPTEITQLPATLCGQILPGEIDYFSFKAEKGMKLVASVKARTLVPYIADAVPGWFQAVIRLTNSKGKEISFNDDFRNAVDPVIISELNETDTYTLSINDAIFRGREDFNYRIDLGEIPFLEYVFPCIGRIGKSTSVTLRGVNLNQNNIKFKPTQLGYGELSVEGKNGFISNPVVFLGLPQNAQVEITPSEKQKYLSNTIVFDSISVHRQVKTYILTAQKNETIAVEIKARRLGSMMDAKLTLRDFSGKKLMEVDDVEDATEGLMTNHADPVLRYKAPKAGSYTLEVADVLGNCGSDYYYMIERVANTPAFQAFVSPANLTIPKGGTALFRVDISSEEKFVPELNFELKGLPKGFLVSSLQSQPGSKFWEISVTAPEMAKEESLSLEVLAHARLRGKVQATFTQTAVPADNMMQAFYYTHHIPAAGFVAEVTPAAPFSLRLSSEMEKNLQKTIPVSPSDSIVDLKIRIIRTAGFTEPIDLALSKKNPMITLDPTRILPDETEKVLHLKISEKAFQKAKRFRYGLSIVGTVNGEIEKRGKRNFQNALYREITPMVVLQKD